MKKTVLIIALSVFCSSPIFAQDQSANSPSVVNININVSKTVQAVSFPNNTSSRIDFTGTPLLPFAKGQAKIDNKKGIITIDMQLQKMSPATQLGPEFLTYVLWAITPEGRAANLGEILLNGDKAKLIATTQMPNFALIITAEPYFAVTEPSEAVVADGCSGQQYQGHDHSCVGAAVASQRLS